MAASPPSSSPLAPPPPVPVSTPPPVSSPPPPSIASPPPDNSSPPEPATSPPPSVNSPPPVQPTSPPPVSSPPPVPATSPPPLVSSPPPVPATSPPPLVSSPPPVPATSPPPLVSSPPPVPATSPPPSSATPPTNAPPPPAVAPPPQTPSPPPLTVPPPPPSSNEPSTSPPPTTSPPSNPPPPPSSISLSPPTQISPPVSHLSPPPGNPSSPPPPLPRNSTDTSGSGSNSGVPVGGIVAAAVVAGILLIGLIGLIFWCKAKRKRRESLPKTEYIHAYSHGSAPQPDSNLIVKTEASSPFVRSGSNSGAINAHSRPGFSYQELYEATNGFAADNLLGEGGFGPVYKGVFANGREVAVKQLKVGGNQGEREFMAEVETISRIHHRHLVSLVGYCIFDTRRLLVYEYMPNQTLHYHLHAQKVPSLDWATRVKVAVGAARGIAYLHEDCHPRIIHRDIKSSNILLDAKFEARVSDFGLAKLLLDVDTHISTRVVGTFGYMAPEYATSGKLTEKSDVYSFGVVLLELITGRRPVGESHPAGDQSLVQWARPLLNYALDTGQVDVLVDPRLENKYVESELLVMIEAAAACVRHSAAKRPRMGQIIRAFDALSPADLSNGMKVGESEMHDASQIRRLRQIAFGNQAWSFDDFSDASRKSEHTNSNQSSVYFSAQKTHNPTFSGQSTTTHDSSGPSSQNVDSSSRDSPSY